MTAPADKHAPAASEHKHALFLLLAAMLLCVAAYAPLLDGPFYYDDEHHILNNSAVTGENLLAVVTLNFWGQGANPDSVWPYRPVTTLINRLTYSAEHPVTIRAGNLLLHLGAGLAFFMLLLRFIMPLPAAFAAAVFLLHPVQSETVLMAVGKADILAALFGLGAAWAFIRHKHLYSLLFFSLALFSKESAALWLAPAALYGLGCQRWRTIAQAFREFTPYFVIGVFAYLAHFWVTGRFADEVGLMQNPLLGADAFTATLNRLAFPARYLLRVLAPVHVPADYSAGSALVLGLGDWRLWILALVGLLLPLGGWRLWRSSSRPAPRLLALGIAGYYALGLLAFQWHAIAAYALADRHLYLPMLGAALALCAGVALACESKSVWLRRSGLVVMIGWLGFVAAMLFPAASAYSGPISLARAWSEHTPGGARAHLMLGNELARRGHFEAAIDELKTADERHPSELKIKLGLAKALSGAGREQEAGERFHALYQNHPEHEDAAYSYAVWLWRNGRKPEAKAVFERAARMWRNSAQLLLALGRLTAELDGIAQGLPLVERACALAPRAECAEAAVRLRAALIEELLASGKKDAAKEELERSASVPLPEALRRSLETQL